MYTCRTPSRKHLKRCETVAKYRITNLHSVTRRYTNSQGQEVVFTPGETKTLKSKPPKRQAKWMIEPLEQTVKPEETELKGDSTE